MLKVHVLTLGNFKRVDSKDAGKTEAPRQWRCLCKWLAVAVQAFAARQQHTISIAIEERSS